MTTSRFERLMAGKITYSVFKTIYFHGNRQQIKELVDKLSDEQYKQFHLQMEAEFAVDEDNVM